jgi:hypothetical protein
MDFSNNTIIIWKNIQKIIFFSQVHVRYRNCS